MEIETFYSCTQLPDRLTTVEPSNAHLDEFEQIPKVLFETKQCSEEVLDILIENLGGIEDQQVWGGFLHNHLQW